MTSVLLRILFLFSLVWGTGVTAEPLVERIGRFEVDWTAMKLRFWGIGDEGEYSDSKKAGWREGMNYLLNNTGKLRERYYGKGDDHGRAAALAVASATYLTNTTYFANGAVKFFMEARLSRSLKNYSANHKVSSEVQRKTRNTGIIVSLDRYRSPAPDIEIVSGEQSVYISSMVNEAAFELRTMGLWVRSEQNNRHIKDLRLGAKPLVINGSVESDGRIRVNEVAWQKVIEGNAGLVEQARFGFVVPRLENTANKPLKTQSL